MNNRVVTQLPSFEDLRGLDVYPGDTVAVGFRTSDQGEVRIGTVLGIESIQPDSYSYSPTRIDVEIHWLYGSTRWANMVGKNSKVSPARIFKVELPDG